MSKGMVEFVVVGFIAAVLANGCARDKPTSLRSLANR